MPNSRLPVALGPAPKARFVDTLLRAVLVYSVEIVIIVFSAVFAFLLRFDFSIPRGYIPVLTSAVLAWIPIKLIAFKALALDRRWARYVSLSDLVRLAASNLAASTMAAVLLWLLNAGVPRSVYVIDFLVCVMFTAGSRIVIRVLGEHFRAGEGGADGKQTLIYGAGSAGAALLQDLQRTPAVTYKVRGFIDDNPMKTGFVLHGVRVLGTGADLATMVARHNIEQVLIAIPSASGPVMKRILEQCLAAGVPHKTVPGLAEIIDGGGLARQIRDVAVEDLLGRVPVSLEHGRISARLQGSVVLVTGAAGSIGSEICRQVARFSPAALVAFEVAETPLFHLQQEMARSFPQVRFHAEIGSIQNSRRLGDVFARHRPATVFHAAAYKHVPMMEAHLFEAIENNVFGTLNVVDTARRYGTGEFVMISSDKAVRPANIMGATKRVAELVVRSKQHEAASFVSVRFGNVLGSNGSVVPLFKDQIERGGPVTVTHPEMRRYFMTIPEACQLVLQATSMGNGGEIFVLDMGEPVKIVELARNLILLSGLRPDVDVEIKFTGVRPGEKLYEELNAEDEGLVTTRHEKIKIFAGACPDWNELANEIAHLRASSECRDYASAMAVLHRLVPDFVHSEETTAPRPADIAKERRSHGVGAAEELATSTIGVQ